ncbi:hypothetical protein [Polyangium sp. y55x31]|uniref:hypothetical protein n=1 Tax=Polyangium sp. y55x31 TaxID=3042688 RepID=UPI0024826C03|nr:hypothetical protein [Polyangium sp. y55x31]MDI1480836.1 hypothetical protein [Polyangium sp. y55x31]
MRLDEAQRIVHEPAEHGRRQGHVLPHLAQELRDQQGKPCERGVLRAPRGLSQLGIDLGHQTLDSLPPGLSGPQPEQSPEKDAAHRRVLRISPDRGAPGQPLRRAQQRRIKAHDPSLQVADIEGLVLHARGDDMDISGMQIDLLQMTASPFPRRQHEDHEEGRDERPGQRRGLWA